MEMSNASFFLPTPVLTTVISQSHSVFFCWSTKEKHRILFDVVDFDFMDPCERSFLSLRDLLEWVIYPRW